MSASPRRFWDFSVRVYRRPGVSDACLELQDRYALDVNLVLCCCWAAGRGRFDQPFIQAATDRSEEWARSVVRPLRAVRTKMKGGAAASHDPAAHDELRARIKADELRAERFQQDMLEALAADSSPTPAPSGAIAARSHLDDYLGVVSVAGDPPMTALFDVVIEACEPEWS